MTFNFTPPVNALDRHRLVMRMEWLRQMRDAGQISKTQFKREYGALASTLWGPDFFSKARARMRQNSAPAEEHGDAA